MKAAEEVMEILEAYDLVGSFRAAEIATEDGHLVLEEAHRLIGPLEARRIQRVPRVRL